MGAMGIWKFWESLREYQEYVRKLIKSIKQKFSIKAHILNTYNNMCYLIYVLYGSQV